MMYIAIGSFLVADALFVWYLVMRDRRERATYKTIGDSCHDFQQSMSDNISAAFSVVAKALDKNTAAMEKQMAADQPKVRT